MLFCICELFVSSELSFNIGTQGKVYIGISCLC